jgi:predicted phosphoribosyltransferase
LEIVLSKKIGHPFHKEFAIGAVTLQNIILDPVAANVSEAYIEEETERIRAILKQRHQWYYGNKSPLSLTGKIVIVVDDGVATGNTLISSVKLIQQQDPLQIVVGLPVSSYSSLKKIESLSEVDKVICLLTPEDFYAVGQFYREFNQVNDNEVVRLLKEANDN